MVLRSSKLLTYVAVCTLSSAVFAHSSASKDRLAKTVQRGTILHARNGFGQENTYINANGIRIEYPIAGLNLICKKPTYEIIWFNPQAKTVMKESIAEFRARTNQPPNERDMSSMPQSAVIFAGVPSTRIALQSSNDPNRFALPEFSTRSATPSKLTKSYFYVLKNVSPNPTLTKFLNTFFHFPSSGGGVPLALTHDRSDGTKSTDFQVQSVERDVTFPDGVFDEPKGFKTVYTQPDVAQGPGYKKQFDDLARDMGLGVPLGR